MRIAERGSRNSHAARECPLIKRGRKTRAICMSFLGNQCVAGTLRCQTLGQQRQPFEFCNRPPVLSSALAPRTHLRSLQPLSSLTQSLLSLFVFSARLGFTIASCFCTTLPARAISPFSRRDICNGQGKGYAGCAASFFLFVARIKCACYCESRLCPSAS